MQRLELSGAVRPIYGSLGFKGLKTIYVHLLACCLNKQYGYLRRREKMSFLDYRNEQIELYGTESLHPPGQLRRSGRRKRNVL